MDKYFFKSMTTNKFNFIDKSKKRGIVGVMCTRMDLENQLKNTKAGILDTKLVGSHSRWKG